MKLSSVPIRVMPAVVSPDEADHVHAGCFVKVNNENGCYWAEITDVVPGGYAGIVHPELGDKDCKLVNANLLADTFRLDEIIDLGCDNFCFC